MTQAISIQSCLQSGNIMGALKHAEMWVIQDRENPEAWFWRGTVQAAGQLEEASVDSWKKALEFNPSHRGACHNITLALMKSGKFQDAKAHLRSIEILLPNDGQIKAWLGHAHSVLFEQEDALIAYEAAINLSGKDPQLLKLAAMCARDLGAADKAYALLNQAIDMAPSDPSLKFERGCLELALGNYKQGFLDYEARWQRETMSMPKFSMPLWGGEDLKGKHILLHDEQGMGDSLMFARFAHVLARIGAKVSYFVRPRLKRIIESLGHNIAVRNNEDPTADFHCPIMSIPQRLQIDDASNLGMDTPYLHADGMLKEKWATKLSIAGDKNKIGLIWQGDPSSQAERGRSQNFDTYLSHLNDDCHYFILQCMHEREELDAIKLPSNVTDLGNLLDLGDHAFVDTAAVMELLDLVITTDTGPAHLAGALNIPTHLILQKVPEWRWGYEGSTSPWYPKMTLFRDDVKAAFS